MQAIDNTVSSTDTKVDEIKINTDEVHKVMGLENGIPLKVSKNERKAGSITQDISEVAGTVTVRRI